MFVLKPLHRAIWIAVFAGVAVSVLVWIARNDPAINFLSRNSQAEWIVFPAAVDSRAYGFASLDATFRREFSLENQPASAHMSIRAMRRVEVKINGTPVQFPPISNWKKIVTIDVAARLRAGTNVIEARVFNYNGPPALWLRLTTDQLSLRSDETWEASFTGSSWRRAALATKPKASGPGNPIAGGQHTFRRVKKSLAVVDSVRGDSWKRDRCLETRVKEAQIRARNHRAADNGWFVVATVLEQ